MKFELNKIVGNLGNFCEVNLNAEALSNFSPFPLSPNPLLDPTFCGDWVKYVHRKNNVKYSFGGYMEDRSFLWRQSYLIPDQSVHLGIDINVPEFSLVMCPAPFKVEEIFNDTDQNGGWGQRILVSTPAGLVLFAHLYGCQVSVGKYYNPNTCIGSVAPAEFNGGWFPHLHIQGILDMKLLTNLDGYSKRYEGMENDYPHPFKILGV